MTCDTNIQYPENINVSWHQSDEHHFEDTDLKNAHWELRQLTKEAKDLRRKSDKVEHILVDSQLNLGCMHQEQLG